MRKPVELCRYINDLPMLTRNKLIEIGSRLFDLQSFVSARKDGSMSKKVIEDYHDYSFNQLLYNVRILSSLFFLLLPILLLVEIFILKFSTLAILFSASPLIFIILFYFLLRSSLSRKRQLIRSLYIFFPVCLLSTVLAMRYFFFIGGNHVCSHLGIATISVIFFINLIFIGSVWVLTFIYFIPLFGFFLFFYLGNHTSLLQSMANPMVFAFLSLFVYQAKEYRQFTNFRQSRLIEIHNDEIKDLNFRISKAYDELQRLSVSDYLTDVANRRRFDEFLEYQWSRLKKRGSQLSLLMIDIDNFKQYNDNYGHPAGDEILKAVAKILLETVTKSQDLVARYGGEEFAVILPETDLDNAKKVALNSLKLLRKLKLMHEYSDISPYITMSIGAASIVPTAQTSIKALLEAADRALYFAKRNGKNQVRIAL